MKKFANFSFYMYTDILFGKDTEKQVASKIREHGGTKVMLVYGKGSIKKIGLYDTVVEALKHEGIPFVELGDVHANPRRSLAIKGLEIAMKENVDFLLAVGGGSSIDTAKAIALGLANGGSFWEFYNGKLPQKMAKVGTINTIAAAGSETSGATVLVDDIDTHLKKAMMHPPVGRPVFAIMNPELTYTVSNYQTAAGAVDIFAHTYERYFVDKSNYLGDQFAEGLMRSVVKYARVALENPRDYEARAELMLAGAFSHNDVTGIGGRNGYVFMAHALEAYLSASYDTSHGAGLAITMPALLQYIVDHGEDDKVARVAQFATSVFDVQPDMQDIKANANEGIRRFRAWIKSIGMPLTLSEMNIHAKDLPAIVKNCGSNSKGILEGYIPFDKNEIEEIYKCVI